MRGIVFIGGLGPGAGQCRVLSRGADLIAAADSGLIAAEDAGIYPDWIVGDMDSLTDLGRLKKYPEERILRYPEDKDYTDTELALRLLWDKGCDETWLLGGGGGRVDHLFAIRSLFERDPSPDRWITAEDDIHAVTGTLSQELPPGSLVSVFPLGAGPWKVESRGLRWPLDDLSWAPGFFGISNIAYEGPFSLRVTKGRFLVILPQELVRNVPLLASSPSDPR
ncbi:MAG: thiamine diphosphokinase [Spirochaetaceae bacterium]|nr:thiamine diphosphokinase [Spirochaetaceae bacterium]